MNLEELLADQDYYMEVVDSDQLEYRKAIEFMAIDRHPKYVEDYHRASFNLSRGMARLNRATSRVERALRLMERVSMTDEIIFEDD